jgi:transposase-like protein
MSEKKYRDFTPEFKKHALELLKRGDKSAAELERELGDHARSAGEVAVAVSRGGQ